MSDNQAGSGDTRDVRTQEGITPKGVPAGPSMTSSQASDEGPLPMPQDPVNAVNPRATPSDFTMDEIDDGETPLDEGMDRLIDPSLGNERLSTNFDVLDLDRSFIVESEEPDFTDDPGTTDLIEVIEEGEVYFPPTDPPVTLRRYTNAGMMDGFSATSDEEPTEPEDHPLRVQGNDEELAEQVRYALAADAYTADLNIEVEVEYGVVYLHGKVRSLEDIEQAEQVAGGVQGIEDVEEDLEIV